VYNATTNQRNISIDILRFFAILLITNSHMEIMYVKFPILATGGVIGNSLFFFCSGFTLFSGRMERFDN
jgi:peptidoglycan/LPS O-acetylase OafA/YrhL